VVYNPYSGQFYYSFTSRIGSAPDQPGFVPLGSLRLQMGVTYMQFEHGWIDSTNDKFQPEAKSQPLESLLGLFRLEYAADMNDRFFNPIKLSTQLNIGLDGFGGVDVNATYTIMEWLGVNLNFAYFWTPMVFEGTDRFIDPDGDGNDNDFGRYPDYEWNPGFFITPSVTLYF
jgi:hypothetical protein